MIEQDLDKKILSIFEKINFSRQDKKRIHFKSVKNFIDYLIKRNVVYKKKSNIKKLGVVRKKELLLNYLEEIQKRDYITKEESEVYFRNFIYPIGLFMSSNFGFVYIDGSAMVLKTTIVLFLALALDLLFRKIFPLDYTITTIALIILLLRYILKFSRKKVFGFGW